MQITDELRQQIREAITDTIGDAYDCTRVWSAWSYGTMGQDDFVLVSEDENRIEEITEAVIRVITGE